MPSEKKKGTPTKTNMEHRSIRFTEAEGRKFVLKVLYDLML